MDIQFMNNNPQRIAPIITSDGSITFYNNEVGEAYHSESGAAEEAVEKFCRPVGLDRPASLKKITIYDICFGLGYNTAAALDMIQESNPACKVEIFGFEIDTAILERAADMEPPFKSYPLVQKAAKKYKAKDRKLNIRLFVGDVRQEICKAPSPADVVFLDPFSPSKEPGLWSVEFFKEIYDRMAPSGVLTTYSCAPSVRAALKETGFRVEDGPSIGNRSPSTVAFKEEMVDPS